MKEIDHILSKLRNKVWLSFMIKSVINSFVIAGFLNILLMILAHCTFIVYVIKKAEYVLLGAITLGIGIGIVKRPSIKKVALIGDALGMKERLITYLEYKDGKKVMIKVFKEELLDTLKNYSIIKKYSIDWGFKKILLGWMLLMMSIGIYCIPSFHMKEALQKQEIHQDIKKETQKLEKMIEKMDQTEELDKKHKQSMKDALLESKNKMKDLFDYDEGSIEIAKLQKTIEGIKEKSLNDSLMNEMGLEALKNMSHQKGTDLSQKIEECIHDIQSGDAQNALEALQEIKNSQNEKVQKDLEKIESQLKDSIKKQEKSINHSEKGIENQIQTQIESMKKRLLAKGEKGIKSTGGENKVSDLAKGENQSTKNSEVSHQEMDRMALGNQWDRTMKNSSGKGGGTTSSQKDDSITRTGKVLKGSATRLGEEEKESTFIKGNWKQNGKLEDKQKNFAQSVQGEAQGLKRIDEKYRHQYLEYMNKEDVPLSKKQLVKSYFTQLNGGEKNGRDDD